MEHLSTDCQTFTQLFGARSWHLSMRSSGIILFVSVVFCMAVAHADDAIRATIERPAVRLRDVSDPDVLVYEIEFELRLTNLTTKSVNVGSTAIVVAIQCKKNDVWTNVNQSSWYDDGHVKYGKCLPMAAGKDTRISNVFADLILLREHANDVGREPIKRFHMDLPCRNGANEILIQSVTTEPVRLQLPQ